MAAIAMCCCAMIGYSSHVRRRGLLLVLPVILSLAFFFIADIDTPRRGFIHVIPRNLISVSQAMSSVPARSPESP